MERLTERTKYGIVGNNKKVTNYPLYKVAIYDELDHGITGQCFDKLAEYEDLEEQGLLLRLPCKAGDIVYAIDGKNIQTLKAKNDIALISDKLCIFAENCHYADYICYDYIGKTIFLTKAEAEQKLKEMEVNEDLCM